jgi:hypothetical protein
MEDEIGSMGNFGATTATGPHHSPAIAATTNKLLQVICIATCQLNNQNLF